jgi:hypothetical protein
MGPLNGVRIVEFAGLGPAPFGAMMLADLGADIIRIDRPGGYRAPDPIQVSTSNGSASLRFTTAIAAPFGPIMAWISPAAIAMETSLSASTAPKRRPSDEARNIASCDDERPGWITSFHAHSTGCCT